MALRLFSDVKFKLVILLISVLYSLNFLFWNVDLVDNFYWINRTSFYQMDFMNILAQVRKSVDSPPGMLTEDHHHTVHEERQVCYSSHLRPKSLHL